MKIRQEAKRITCIMSAITLCAAAFISLATLQTGKAEAKAPEPYDEAKLESLCWDAVVTIDGNAVMCGNTKIATWHVDEDGTQMMAIEDNLPEPPQTSAGGNRDDDPITWSFEIEVICDGRGAFGFDAATKNAVCGDEPTILYESEDEWPDGVSRLMAVCRLVDGNNGSFTLSADGDITCIGQGNKIGTWVDGPIFKAPRRLEYYLFQVPETSAPDNPDWSEEIAGCIQHGGTGLEFNNAENSFFCKDENYFSYDRAETPHPDSFAQLITTCQKTTGNDGNFTLHADNSITCNGTGNKVATWTDSWAFFDLNYQLISDSNSEGDTTPSTPQAPETPPTPAPEQPNTSNDPDNTIDDETRQLISQAQAILNQIKSDPVFQQYQQLINAVKAAEELLAQASDSATTSRATTSEQNPDQPYTNHTTTVRLAKAIVATVDQQDLTNAIKAIGDALRALGIKTDLGQTSATPTLEDLRAAIKTAKRAEKYSEYASLARAVEATELAIANGTVSTATLASLKNTLASTKDSNPTTGAPDTGINKSSDNSTTTTQNNGSAIVKVLVAVSVVLAIVGASILTYRQIARKEA